MGENSELLGVELFISKLMNQSLLFLLIFSLSTSIFSAVPDSFKFHVDRFQIDDFMPIDSALVDSTLTPFQNQEHTLESLLKVSKALETAIRDQGYAFYRVVLPQQALGKQAVITLKIVAFSLSDVSVEGNLFFDKTNILNSLPALVVGESPNTKILARNIKVATHHPLKDMQLTFKQSKNTGKPNQINAIVEVTDAKSDNYVLILANTGNTSTGKYRLTGSYQNTNLFNKDHILNVSYTTSPSHIEDVSQYGGSYSMPLYSQSAWLTGYLVYSEVNSGKVGTLTISGAGTMMGVHYLKIFQRIGNYEHSLDMGFDFKIFENNILFGAVSLIPNVTSAPISTLYKSEFPWKGNKIELQIQFSANTGLGEYNNDLDYSGNRTNASKSWNHLRYGLTINRPFKGWNLKGALSGQYSHEPLISGEQFSLGGSTSIRGYEAGEIAKDVGYSIKLEALSPIIKSAKYVVFVDYGTGYSQDVQAGDPDKEQTIASIGTGVRWQYNKQVLVSFDLANALKNGSSGQTESGNNKIHATIMMNF